MCQVEDVALDATWQKDGNVFYFNLYIDRYRYRYIDFNLKKKKKKKKGKLHFKPYSLRGITN
jgi:hypothetical protein